ncbi:thymus-specific serine protease-like [Trichechus manatus latirostris]|uniref:Thymus-specific serine protease-like n=1 Tax=Trichechus manatus latirostris TaxID=127582 RepID=A0A2Y9R5Z9_TRIMA|nr:thymus-specific serine protease-like [Trichechus manatus latirostris]
MDQLFIVEKIMLVTAITVQANRKSNTTKRKMGEMTTDEFCEKMTNTSLGSPYHRYASVIRTTLRNKGFSCYPASYKESVNAFSSSSLDRNTYKTAKPWLYQSCTEFGYFFTTDLKNQSFTGLPLRYFAKKCSDVFGSVFNSDSLIRGAMVTNRYYGGLNVNGSKIIFLNGANDPWYHLGVTKDISDDLLAVFIKGNFVVNG